MIPQPYDSAPDATELDRTVRDRWRDRRLTGRPGAGSDADATWVLHVATPPGGPVTPARVTAHTVADVVARHRAMCGEQVDRALGPGPDAPAPGAAAPAPDARDGQVLQLLGCDDPALEVVRATTPTYTDSVWWTVAQLWEAGLLQAEAATVTWCPACRCEVGPDGVATAEEIATTALVRFPVHGGGALHTAGASVIVAVGAPAALSSVDAVATAPDADLVLAQASGDAYPVVIARDAVAAVLGDDAAVHRDLPHDEVAGLRCRHPVTQADVGVVVVDGADRSGSATGTWVPGEPPGTVDDGGPQLDALRAGGLLLRVDARRQAVRRCTSCDGPVDARQVDTWSVVTSGIADNLAAERAAVTRSGAADGAGTVTTDDGVLRISRPGHSGTALPLWRCDACGDVAAVSGRARLAALAGGEVDALDHRDGSAAAATFACRACGDGTARRLPQVVDGRVVAATMPFARFGFPALPGSDARVARRCHAAVVVDPDGETADAMLVLASLLWDAGSHDAVLVTGTGSDAAIDVADLCARHGVDAVRWAAVTGAGAWTAGGRCDALAAAAADAVVAPLLHACTSFEKASADAAWSFADAARVSDVAARPVWDRWILAELADAVATVRVRLDELDPAAAARRIRAHVAAIGLWRSQRTADPGTTAAQDGASALATFHECLVTVAALLAPFTPHLSDELFERLVRSSEPAAPDSVHLLRYPVPHAAARDEDLRLSMRADHDHGLRLARDVIRALNELRTHQALADDDRITVRIEADAEVAAAIETHRRIIADGVHATRIELGPTADGVPVPLNDAPARVAVRSVP